MYRYKNVSGMDQSIIGRGLVPADTEFETAEPIHNPSFELLSETQPQPEPPKQPEPAPETEVNKQEAEQNGA